MNLTFVQLIYAFNSDLLKVEFTPPRTLGAKELEFTKICIREECGELFKALDVSDPQRRVIEQADAMIDSLYFSVGHLYRMGVLSTHAEELIDRALVTGGSDDMQSNGTIIEPLSVHMVQAVRGRQIANIERVKGFDLVNDRTYVVDTIVSSIEGLLAMGLTFIQVYGLIEIVDTQNKKKKKGVKARRDLGVEDVVKPEDWVSPEEMMFAYLFGGK